MAGDSSSRSGGWRRALNVLLLSFVFAAGYNIVSARFKAEPAPDAARQEQPAVKPEVKLPAAAKKAVPAEGLKTAVVYYFYTNTRCASCKAIEAYTREAVATRLAAGYKGWKVEFKGVNLDDKPNEHFVADYGLSSKSVVVQKFAGEKPLNWGRLDKVWQLLGNKEAFIGYVADETHKLLDEK